MSTGARVVRCMTHPVVVTLLRIGLGAVFIAASLDKIRSPGEFAQNIANYRLVPDFAINALAILLPWLELVVGALLLVGVWTRASVAIVNLLLVVFIAAIGQALARGLDISCGCFNTDPTAHAMGRWTLYWDIIWLGWGVLVWMFDRGRFTLPGLISRPRPTQHN